MASKIIEEAANKAIAELVPTKSRKIYEKEYDEFKKWCQKKGSEKILRETVLLAYFHVKSSKYMASTIWAKYSMLKTMLKIKENLDISKCSELLAFLKRKNENYKAKKSKILTVEQVNEFLSKAPNEEFLMIKVALILGVAGACRSIELVNLLTTDVQDLGSSLLFNIRNTKNGVDRTFIVKNSSNNATDFVQICRKFKRVL